MCCHTHSLYDVKTVCILTFSRSQRTLENRLAMDDDKITLLEQQAKSLKVAAGDAERRYEEVNAYKYNN